MSAAEPEWYTVILAYPDPSGISYIEPYIEAAWASTLDDAVGAVREMAVCSTLMGTPFEDFELLAVFKGNLTPEPAEGL
jgi:hypothetical protein